MANIGSYGAAKTQALNAENETFDTFNFYGKEFRIANEISAAVLFDFGEVISSDVDTADVAQAAAVKMLLKECVHPGDWSGFWGYVRAQKGDLAAMTEVLVKLSMDLIERVTGRPTERSSDSSGGPSAIGSGTNGTASPGQVAAYTESWPQSVPQVVGMAGQVAPNGSGGSGPYQPGVPLTTPTS